MSTIIYPGTFDPITSGHVDLVARAARLFERVIIAVAASPVKMPLFSLDERISLCEKSCLELQNVRIIGFDGLLTELVSNYNGIVMRGLRSQSDFEYEFQLAHMNRAMLSEMETIFMIPSEHLGFISSTLVREIASLGGDISNFVPLVVKQALEQKLAEPS